MTVSPLAVVAGTGFYDLDALEDRGEDHLDTPWGEARVVRGTWHGVPVVFLTRHGAGHALPPHLVNYRANIRALADLGVRDVLAVNVTGSIDEGLSPGDLVCVDDFLDLTKQRPLTFFDGSGPDGVVHTDVSAPYDEGLRRELLDAAAAVGRPMVDGGVYAAFEGPRFETAAEIRLARLAGGTVAGMTGVPEVVLAREAGLRYAAVSLVVNPATGVSDEPITMAEIEAVLARSRDAVLEVLDEVVHTRATFADEPDPAGTPTAEEPSR